MPLKNETLPLFISRENFSANPLRFEINCVSLPTVKDNADDMNVKGKYLNPKTDGMSVELIAKYTGLTAAEIAAL